jgi:hypothetical protein
MGTPQAKIDPVFQNRLTELTDNANQQAQSALTGSIRPWQVPSKLTTSLLDIPNLHTPAFDRSNLNASYVQVTGDTTTGGVVADCMALKMQIDYNAVEERAFRLRHATACRCRAIAFGRRNGHGQVAGIFQGGVQQTVADMLRSGGLKATPAAAGA